MAAQVMERPSLEASPRLKAKAAGFFYLLNILTIFLAVLLFRGLIVSGNPAATATNILAHELRFRLGFACELISTSCSIVVAALFYVLLRPVNRTVSLLAAFFRLIACSIAVVGDLLQLAPLQILGAHYLSVFSLAQSQALALLLYAFSGQVAHTSIVFFGFHFVLIGYLIFTSTFLPRILGVLVAPAGLGGLIFLFPPLATRLFPYFVPFGLIAEVSLTVWFLAVGVNVQRWTEQAHAAAE